eukprot:NODE_72_length_23514_cov_0.560624.p7 type:complete len:307 gc:universal NODE_72_length_23514_cov_0.560624:19418-20338(+)
MSIQQELILKDGRIMQYKECGDFGSATKLVLFHGLFAIGDFSTREKQFKKLKVHCLSPNLPGWVKSSSWPNDKPIKEYANDVLELLNHKFKDLKKIKIYTAGGSYGSVFAQIVAGNLECVSGFLSIGGFSSFYLNKDYAKGMTWFNWISVGTPGYYFPLIQWLLAKALKKKISTQEGARSIMEKALNLSSLELEQAKEWTLRTGRTIEEVKESMTNQMVQSLEFSTDGYIQVPRVLHADWGFVPAEITNKYIMIVGARDDHAAHYQMQKWLADSYECKLKTIEGGHISAIFCIDLLFEEFINNMKR